ncbi:MAG: hypothetical protein DMG42_07755 [Acidobacteria bacterium]|nr:MAG: hypothetical protein DMG42_07755 [Acidobacteriota bacterium]
MSIVLIHGDDLLWIIGIDGDAGLGKISGLRSQGDDAGVRSFGRELSETVSGNCAEPAGQKRYVQYFSVEQTRVYAQAAHSHRKNSS